MERTSEIYAKYVSTLKKELLPAMGCTEPIAVAYVAAKARDVLGVMPETVLIQASGNIIKNVKSVVVPNTDDLKGLEAAAAAGVVAGDSTKLLEVISHVTADQKKEIAAYLNQKRISVEFLDSGIIFDLIIVVRAGADSARVRIVNEHTNIVLIEKNGEVISEKPVGCGYTETKADDQMSVDSILDFARTCDIEDVREVIARQIKYNSAIAEEGLKHDWGANIGKVILSGNENNLRARAKAKAAAGSDARMSGCELPVVINSGSGNQGITISVPIIEHARSLGASEEELYRALILANLLGLYQKAGIGRLSAYCGAVSAACASGAGISFLMGENNEFIKNEVINCLAITSGIVCDGAKPSCAAKIATSIDGAYLAIDMTRHHKRFFGGDGIVKDSIENTISSVTKLGRDGMKETDKEILRIMIEDEEKDPENEAAS